MCKPSYQRAQFYLIFLFSKMLVTQKKTPKIKAFFVTHDETFKSKDKSNLFNNWLKNYSNCFFKFCTTFLML